jgi:O-antigen/teichoic acid export membrane protein
MILSLCGGGIAVLVGGVFDRILIFWMGHNMPQVEPILYLLLIDYTAAVLLTGAGTSLCLGVGRAGINSGYSVFGLIANVILKVILVITIGALGSVVASTISWVLASLLLLVLMHRALDLPWAATRGALASLGIAILLVAVARFALQFIPLPETRAAAFWSAVLWGSILLAIYSMLLISIGVLPLGTLRNGMRLLIGRFRVSKPQELGNLTKENNSPLS